MTSLRVLALALPMFAACSSSSSGNHMPTPDAAPVSTMVTITGTTSSISASGTTALPGVAVQAFREGETTPIASATSDANGAYTLTATTNGTAIDGYVLAKKDTYLDTYLYPPAPLSADFSGATVLMLTSATRDLVGTIAQVPGGIDTSKAFIGLKVVDAANANVAGAVVTASPSATIIYNANNLPSKSATATDVDGVGYVANATPGQVTVGATKSGSTFHAHAINARAGVITLTVVQ